MRFNRICGLAAAVVVFLLDPLHTANAQTGTAPAAGSGEARDVSPPSGFASDDWVRQGTTPWAQEMTRRQSDLAGYLRDTDPSRARKYGFREGHTPALAWNWFSAHPIGYGGVPYVLLQTFLSLDPATETDENLRKLAAIWKKKSAVPAESGRNMYTLDHLGLGPHPEDYTEGVAKDPGQRRHLLPNGLVYDPEVKPRDVRLVKERLKVFRSTPTLELIAGKLRSKLHDRLYGDYPNYERDRATFQRPPQVDAVFVSCSGCHQGRVIAGGRMDGAGNIVERGRMHFMPGMPSTEVENQYYSQLLMETGLWLVESGFTMELVGLPEKKSELIPNRAAVTALFRRMLDRALDAETAKTIYGPQPEQIRRAMLQTYWTAKDFPVYVGELIGTAIKTQYVYHQVAAKYAFNPNNKHRKQPDQPVPDPMGDRMGQMDAFGIASGLVAIHTLRKDNSFLRFLCKDSKGQNPLFSILNTNPGPSCDNNAELENAGRIIRDTVAQWAPPVPGPVDIPSLSWTGHRVLANWDGNQGASARTLASGTSATGDPLKVNVRIHEPLNAFINNLPPPPYPFAVDREKARRGMTIFNGEHLMASERCADCHRPHSDEVVPAKHLGVDENRAMVNTDVSRYALAGLVMEACRIFIGNNPGNEWCLPRDAQRKVIRDWTRANDDYFKDTPGRVRNGKHGYKVDMQHGIWARAPYLHNGSVPTLGHMLCPQARPKKFLRGVLFYDEALVGFEWAVVPRERYSPHETQLVKEYDTGVFGRSNSGHPYGTSLCPDLAGLDPVADRREITRRILDSRAGDLIEYMKTF